MANELAMIPIADLEKMAQYISKSNLFGIKTVEQAVTLMLLAQAEGRPAMTVARDYNIINGRPAKTTEAMLRDFLEAGGKVEWHKLDDTIADATFSHPAGGSIRLSWDMKRATAAGLGAKEMWSKYRRQMLRSRVVSEGIRTVCPSATSGMYVPDEVIDFEPAKPEKIINPVRNALEGSDEPSPEVMEALRELGAMLVQMIEIDGNPTGAYMYLTEQNLDSEQKLRLWQILGPNTKTRAALKKEGAVQAKNSRGEVANEVQDVHSQQEPA